MNISIQFMLIIDVLYFQVCIIWKHDDWRFHMSHMFQKKKKICSNPFILQGRLLYLACSSLAFVQREKFTLNRILIKNLVLTL